VGFSSQAESRWLYSSI